MYHPLKKKKVLEKINELDIEVLGMQESGIQRKKRSKMMGKFLARWNFLSNGDSIPPNISDRDLAWLELKQLDT